LALVRSASTAERDTHRQVLLENIDFLIDTLTGAHARRQRMNPVGCPSATPEQLARGGTTVGATCRYTLIEHSHTAEADDGCRCGDPLVDSDDPLDAVAAVALGSETEAPAKRFFQRTPRRTVAQLRDQYGAWEDIAEFDHRTLTEALENACPLKGISEDRIARLETLLTNVDQTDYTDGVTLRGFSKVRYETYVDFLTQSPGIQQQDAWWLVQTAFDKPVWPVDPLVDEFLCALGLLDPEDYETEGMRRESMETALTDRLIAPLYRALATHAVTEGPDVCGSDCELRKFLLTHRLREQQKDHDGPTVVDLFAGAGGLSCGLSQAGLNIRWAIDIEPDAVATYRLNHPEIPHENVVCGDVRDIDLTERIQGEVSTTDVLVGGPPCQSLSQAGYRSRRAADEDYSILDDTRTTLYTQYVNVVDEIRPKAIVMENVEGMVNEVGDTGVRVIDWVLEDLAALDDTGTGYHLDFRVQDMSELGVPQQRERVLLIGLREDLAESQDEVTELLENLSDTGEPNTLQDGLSGLPRLRRGEGGRVLSTTPRGGPSSYLTEHELHTDTALCFNHQAREHPMEKDQILFDEALRPGDTGWDVKYGGDGEYAEYIEYDVGTEDNPRFKDKYRMLEWTEPSPTIVAHLAKDANAYVLPDYYQHARPDQERSDTKRNRGITPREAARLQSFPDDYIFLGSFTSWFRQIGNAVPPIAGKQLGKTLHQAITGRPDAVGKPNNQSQTSEAVSDD
jgi:DNA (cytosine-5)-methyltransferase 1